MLVGLPPFYNRDQNTQKMFAAIREKEVNFSSKVVISSDAKDFVLKVLCLFGEIFLICKKLLKKKPEERIGYKGAQEIKAHKWFSNINWKLLSEKKVSVICFLCVILEIDRASF